MKLSVLVSILLPSITALPANSSPVFNCQVEYMRQLDGKGELARSNWEEPQIMDGLSFTFDPSTGTYETQSGVRWAFEIVEDGNHKNSLKAIRVNKGPASVAMHSLSILTWDQLQFLLTTHNEVRSGLCKLEIGTE